MRAFERFTQIMKDHACGCLVTDREVADAYRRTYDIGAPLGLEPGDRWSNHHLSLYG